MIKVEEFSNGSWLVNSDFADILRDNGIDSHDKLWSLEGESVKKFVKERGTERAILKGREGEELETYVKRYQPLPLKEHVKGITSLKPVFTEGAIHEWEAILAFHEAGIPTMIPIAAGKLGDGRTVNITLGITDYRRASEIFSDGLERENRIKLIENIANLAGKMHFAKFAHQDFYLVHLFVKADLQVLPIDLQRLITGKQFRKRWQVKDLGQLLYSALDYASQTDILRFWKIYTDTVDKALFRNKSFIASVNKKAQSIRARSERKKKNKLIKEALDEMARENCKT